MESADDSSAAGVGAKSEGSAYFETDLLKRLTMNFPAEVPSSSPRHVVSRTPAASA